MEGITYKAGIVGCGRIGCEFDDCHVNAYKAAQGIDLVAVADIDGEKLNKCAERWGLKATKRYPNYEELMEEEVIDVLSICTQSDLHYEITKKAVECGVNAIYCEKPIADNLADARHMITLCKEHDVVLQINHKHRFSTAHQLKRDYVQSKGFGATESVSFYYVRGIANSGSHMFDFLRFFFGGFLEVVTAEESVYNSHMSFDPNLSGEMKLGDDVVCFIHACNEPIFRMNVVGVDHQMSVLVNDYYNPSTNLLVLGVEHLIACLKDRKESISSGEDGYKALEAIVAFKKANRIKHSVKFPISKDDEVYREILRSQ